MYPLLGCERRSGEKFLIRADLIAGADEKADGIVLRLMDGTLIPIRGGSLEAIQQTIASAIHFRHTREVEAAVMIDQKMRNGAAHQIAIARGNLPPLAQG